MIGQVGVGDGLGEWAVVGVCHVCLHGFAQVVRFEGDVLVVPGGLEGALEGHAAGGGAAAGAFDGFPGDRVLGPESADRQLRCSNVAMWQSHAEAQAEVQRCRGTQREIGNETETDNKDTMRDDREQSTAVTRTSTTQHARQIQHNCHRDTTTRCTLTVVSDSNPVEFTNEEAISRNSFSLSASSSKKSSGIIAFGSDGLLFFPSPELLLNCIFCMELLLPRPITVLVLCFQNDGNATPDADDRAMFAMSCLRTIRATDVDILL